MEIFTVSSLDDELPRACLALLPQRFSELWDDPKLQRITYPLDEVCCCCDRLTCPGFSGHRLIERLASTRRQDEEIEVHGGADRLDSRGDGSRRGAGRGQAARSQRADDLHVEEAARVVPAGRRSAAEAARAGECPAEEAGGGARPRDRGDERDRQKNGERVGPSRAGGLRGAPRTVAAPIEHAVGSGAVGVGPPLGKGGEGCAGLGGWRRWPRNTRASVTVASAFSWSA